MRRGCTKERSKLDRLGKARLVQAGIRFGKQWRGGNPVEKQPCGGQPLCEGERFYGSPTPSRESSREGPGWIVTPKPKPCVMRRPQEGQTKRRPRRSIS